MGLAGAEQAPSGEEQWYIGCVRRLVMLAAARFLLQLSFVQALKMLEVVGLVKISDRYRAERAECNSAPLVGVVQYREMLI
jgi:hypothetical protein